MKKIIYILIILLFTEFVSAQDYTGIGTTTPSTMLDINGALRRGQAGNMAGTNTDVNLTANSRILIHKLL